MCKRHVWLTVVLTIAASAATFSGPAWAQRQRNRTPAPAPAPPAATPEETADEEPDELDAADETEVDAADETDAAPDEERVDELDERLTYLEEALDEVEKRTVLDRMQIGLDYRMIINHFSYTGPNPANPLGGDQVGRTTAEVWSHRLIIPMRADITPSLRFTARLGMFKHFGDNDQAPFFFDFQGTRVPRDAGVRVEHAWLDWFVTDWLALSAGRLSYLGRNPPGELKEHTGYRIPTWGLNLIDGEYEAATVTITPLRDKFPDLYLRAFYVSWFSDLDDARGEYGFLESGPNPRILGAIADMRIPKLDRTYVQLGYLTVPRFPALPIPIPDPAFDPDQDFTNAPAPFNGSLLFPSVLPDSLGSVHSVSALVEVLDRNIGAGLSLDGFFGAALNIASPSGDAIEYELPNPANPAMRVSTPFFVLISDGDSTLSTNILTGLRLSLPKWKLPEPARLGVEFNYGSRYSISFAVPSDQLVSKWTVRGQALDTYLIVPVYPDRMFVRLGVLYIDGQYFNGIVGVNPAVTGFDSAVPPVSQDILNFNMVVQVTL